MSSWILLLAVLICPVVMGTMMLLMWRGMRSGDHRAMGQAPSEVGERESELAEDRG